MTTSAWHHAAAAVSAMAGDAPSLLAHGLAEPSASSAGARRAFIEAGPNVAARAGRVVAERLRVTLPRGDAPAAGRGGRVLAVFLAAQPAASRSELARALSAESLAAAQAASAFALMHRALGPAVARWFACALRAGVRPTLATWDALVAELSGESPARDTDALRVERALRVAGLRAESEAAARVIAGKAS